MGLLQMHWLPLLCRLPNAYPVEFNQSGCLLQCEVYGPVLGYHGLLEAARCLGLQRMAGHVPSNVCAVTLCHRRPISRGRCAPTGPAAAARRSSCCFGCYACTAAPGCTESGICGDLWMLRHFQP